MKRIKPFKEGADPETSERRRANDPISGKVGIGGLGSICPPKDGLILVFQNLSKIADER